jgi:hypothetical protein
MLFPVWKFWIFTAFKRNIFYVVPHATYWMAEKQNSSKIQVAMNMPSKKNPAQIESHQNHLSKYDVCRHGIFVA